MANSKISGLTSATTPLAGTETLPIVQSSTTKQVSIANVTAGRAVSALSYSGTATSDLTFAAFTSSAKGWQVNGSASAINLYITGTSYSFNSIGASQSWLWNYNSALNIGSDGSFETRIVVGGSAVLRAQTTGDVKIDTGNLIQGTAAKGINFTANTPASGMTSQLLNWYEEGTFTPTILLGGADTGNVYSAQIGFYTRIGRQVFINLYVALSTKGSATGALSVGGLPFTSINTTSYFSAVAIRANNFSNAFMNSIQGQINANVTTVSGFQYLVAGVSTGITDTSVTNTTSLMVSGSYMTS